MSNKRYSNELISATFTNCPVCNREIPLHMGDIAGIGTVTKGTCPQCSLIIVTGNGLIYSQAIAIADNDHAYPGTIWFD